VESNRSLCLNPELLELFKILLNPTCNLSRRSPSVHRLRYLGPPSGDLKLRIDTDTDMEGTHLFFSPSGISSSSRSKRRCSSTDHAILNVSDLGPRERFGLPLSICTSFSTSLAFGGVLRGGDDGGLRAFRNERLSATALTRGKHGVGVNESGISDVCGCFRISALTGVELTNVLSAWEVALQTKRSVGRRRQPDPTRQRCGRIAEWVGSTVGAS
jgi:hypothetical protein